MGGAGALYVAAGLSWAAVAYKALESGACARLAG